MSRRKADVGDDVQRDIFDIVMNSAPSSGSVLVESLKALPGTSKRPWMARPFILSSASGKVWSVAYDESTAVAVQESGPYEAAPEESSTVLRNLRAALDVSVPSNALRVKVESLREWAGPPPEYYSTLSLDDLPLGYLASILLDLPRLALVLTTVPSRSLYVWDASAAFGVQSVGLEALGRWRAYIAGVLVEDTDRGHKAFS